MKDGLVTVDAPLSRIPLYVRAGSIVPTGPDVQHTMKKSDPLIIYVYTGSDGAYTGSDGSFTLYDDEGVNYNYEQNKFTLIPLTYDDIGKTLTIHRKFGGFDGEPQTRTIYVAFITPDSPRPMDFNIEGLEKVTYDGSEVTVKLK